MLNSIEKISSIYNPTNIKQTIDSSLNSDIKNLSSFLEPQMKNIQQIISNQKNIEHEYKITITNLNSKESEINEVIENYSNYLNKNKTLLIRNEILNSFVQKINITKDEKDNLVDQNLFDEKFFKLIVKMTEIKNDIKVIERNSEHFSKNLLFSIKENYNIVDELVNEKIVIYLKKLFRTINDKRSNIKKFSIEEYKNILLTLGYLSEKENYLNFILKEYTQMRKKNLEEIIRNSYLKISKLEEIFKRLIEDFEFNFLKEFLLIFCFFNDNELFNFSDHQEILNFLNYHETLESESGSDLDHSSEKNKKDILNNLLSKIKNSKLNSLRKDYNFYIPYLNQILFIIEELFYVNINNTKNQNNLESNISEIYKITILSYYYLSKIESVLKENNFSFKLINENLNLFSMLSNYKKSFSKILSKVVTDTLKNLQKIQKNLIGGFKEENSISGNNENMISKIYIQLSEEFSRCFSYFYNFGMTLSNEEKENLNPKAFSCLKLLFEFFNIESFNDQTNIVILLKTLNLLAISMSKFEGKEFSNIIKDEINQMSKTYAFFEEIVVKNLTTSIVKSTNFEENLKKTISHEQTINLIEHIMEKSQLYFLNLNNLSDFTCKEIIKDKVKKQILNLYKDILSREQNLNLSFFSEEEFKNYLEIL